MQLIKEEKITNSTMISHRYSTDGYSILSPLNPCLNPNTSFTTLVDNFTTNNNVVIREEITNSNIASTSYDLNNNMNLQWNSEFPRGYRFCPKDEELIQYYLQRRILNLNLAHDKIKDVNIYATTPDKLSEEYEPVGENEWYFFTPRERKYRNGCRPNRAANRVEGGKSDGYWKATGADKDIVHPSNEKEVIGHKKALVFYKGKSPKGEKTNWIMHEFRVANTTTRKRLHDNDMRLDDCVLCRIYNKIERSSKGSIKMETNNDPNPNPNDQEEEVEAEAEETIVAKDEKLPPEEDQLLYDHHYIDEEAMRLFEEHIPQFIYNHTIDCIVKQDDYYPPQPPDLVYTFPDRFQNGMKPIYDDFYFHNYPFDNHEKNSFFSNIIPLSNIQGELPCEYSPTFLDDEKLNNRFIASPNNPSSRAPCPQMDVDEDVVID